MNEERQIFGHRSIIEAIRSGKPIYKIFAQKGLSNPLFKELEALAHRAGIAVSYVPQEKLNYLAKGKNHQGVAAHISPIEYCDLETLVSSPKVKNDFPLILLLDGISDVRNFGAIIRTAECVGVNGIVIPKTGSAAITQDTVKTSAGAVFNVPICRVDHLKDAVFYLQQSDFKIYAATEKTTKTIYETDMKVPLAIIVGSEDKGISPSLLKLADELCRIPMYQNIHSLNVSVACAVTLYEAVRQRRFLPTS